VPEFLSFIGVLTLGFSAADALMGSTQTWGNASAVVTVVLFWGWSLAVRFAMLVAIVEADDSGIRWRSLFRSSTMSWTDVDCVTVGTMLLVPGTPLEWRTPVLVVMGSDGAARKVRASAWCNRQSLERWAHEVTSA
jgi:hypothetical protein